MRCDSMTASSGIEYSSSATRTSSAWMIASVSGSFIVNFVPSPCTESTSKTPLRRRMFFFTTSMPTPRPETSVTWSAVEKPGVKISSMISRSLRRSASSMMPDAEPPSSRTRCRSIPPPSSEISMMT